jgi:type VI secretion system protein ImpL
MAIADTARNAIESPVIRLVAAIAAVVALIAVVAWLGLFTAIFHSRWFLEIALAAAAIVVFAVLFWCVPWFREWRFVNQGSSGYRVGGEESPQEFRAKFVSTIGKLKSLPQASGKGDPLYSLPWFLMLGPAQSGKTAALAAAERFSPITAVAPEGTANFDCWVSNTMVVLDTAGRYAIAADAAKDRGEWYRLLRLIHHYHGHDPMSGLIITIAADQLGSEPEEKLRELGGKLRERVEESIQELGVDAPVYVLVTKCDLLEGFQEFFGLLPQRVLSEAVGYVDDSGAASNAASRGAAAFKRFQAGVRSVYDRLHILRLSIFNGKTAEQMRQPIFCFPEEFRALEGPLEAFIEPLAGEDVRYHPTLLRGIFFASSAQQGAPISSLRRQLEISAQPAAGNGKQAKGFFLNDLFASVLPRDRALAGPAVQRSKA